MVKEGILKKSRDGTMTSKLSRAQPHKPYVTARENILQSRKKKMLHAKSSMKKLTKPVSSFSEFLLISFSPLHKFHLITVKFVSNVIVSPFFLNYENSKIE